MGVVIAYLWRILFVWAFFCVLSSAIKARLGKCGQVLDIDYFVYSDLMCQKKK